MSEMSNQSFSMNSVKEAGANIGEGPARCPTEQQGGSSSHHTTAKGGRRRSGLKKLIEL